VSSYITIKFRESQFRVHISTALILHTFYGNIKIFRVAFSFVSGVELFGTAATTGLLHQPQMIGDGGEIGGMKIGRGNRSTRRKPAPALLYPPQIPHD
jgi:hypothetical protein